MPNTIYTTRKKKKNGKKKHLCAPTMKRLQLFEEDKKLNLRCSAECDDQEGMYLYNRKRKWWQTIVYERKLYK